MGEEDPDLIEDGEVVSDVDSESDSEEEEEEKEDHETENEWGMCVSVDGMLYLEYDNLYREPNLHAT